MNIDNKNRAYLTKDLEEMKTIKNHIYKELYDDSITLGNIMSGNFDVFFNLVPSFFSEAILEIKNSILLFDYNKVTGGYGSLKAASEILLMILYVFAEGDIDKQNERISQWKNPENNFKKMISEIDLWKNYSEVINEFPSYKKKISISNNRINKMRHKNSARYFESIKRNWQKKWQENREKNIRSDIEFVISHFLLTWLIIDPVLIIVSTNDFHNRFPDSMSQFPNNIFLSKYLPETRSDNFIHNFPLTKEVFKNIKNMYRYSESQLFFRELGFLTNDLEITQCQRSHFRDLELLIYDLFKSDKVFGYENIIIYGDSKFYKMPKGKPILIWSFDMWENNNSELGHFFKSYPMNSKLSMIDKYKTKTIIFKNKKILLLKEK